MWTAISLASVALIVWSVTSLFKRRRDVAVSTTTIHSTIEKIREIGDLCVLEVNFKEVVTHTKKSGGLLATDGKMLLICQFSVEFRYDLRRIKFEEAKADGCRTLVIPPYFAKISMGDIQFYHEEKAAVLFGLFPVDFSVEERNQIVAEARNAVKQQAISSLRQVESKIQMSAATTLKAVLSSGGVSSVEFKFLPPDPNSEQVTEGALNLLSDKLPVKR